MPRASASNCARARWRSAFPRCRATACCLASGSGRPAQPVQRALFERRILTGTASDPEVLRLLPPLSFSRAEADLLLAGLAEVLA